jgi:CelD/BcsL family acetyltransferase involved in cellulose biosynthesis
MRLQRLDSNEIDWDLLDGFADRLVYQTREWLRFVERTQGAEPVVAALRDGGEPVGYFTGLVTRRFGVRILGSPMPGWTTGFMGFNLDPGVPRRAAVEALLPFAFGELGCAHLELKDRELEWTDVEGLGFAATPWRGLQVDLSRSQDEIWAGLKGPCRTAVRKAERQGVTVEEASGPDFAEDFYPQLTDVFAKQQLVPPYGIDRVRALIRDVEPGGHLLLLRARDSDGTCVATGIFPGMNRTMHFLAGGSLREHQHLRPNEALMWHALRYWKSRGAEIADLGGYMDYKRKWGTAEISPPFLRRSRNGAVGLLRNAARAAYDARQRLQGRLRH